MRHIKYTKDEGHTYTVVNTDTWDGELETHPSIVDHPDWFEIVDCDIPNNAQYLIYQP